MKPVGGRVDFLAGGALVFAALCGGCMMQDAAQLRVDALWDWQTGHANAVRAVVEAQTKASEEDAREHIRQSLLTTKLRLRAQLHEAALNNMADCGTDADAESRCVQLADAGVQWIEGRVARTQADRINRVGDRAEEFQLVEDLHDAQEAYWEAVARHRQECAQAERDRLTARLTRLGVKFRTVLDETTDRFVRLLHWHWRHCDDAIERTLDELAGHAKALRNCKSWKPSECEAPEETGTNRHMRSPLHRCLAAPGPVRASMNEAIRDGKRQLQGYFLVLALDGRSTARANPTQCAPLPQGGGD